MSLDAGTTLGPYEIQDIRLLPHALSSPAMRFLMPAVNLDISPSMYPPTHGISAYFAARPIRNIENCPSLVTFGKTM